MSIYLITNRSVTGQTINNTGKERGLSTFRIAECEIDETQKKLEDRVTYELLPDIGDKNHYRTRNGRPQHINKLANNATALAGSEKLFASLYNKLINKNTPSDVLFFIHGFANDVDSSKANIYQLYKKYVESDDSPIEHLVYFSWPTIGRMALTYWDDQEDAENAGLVVSRLFRLLRGFYIDMFERTDNPQCGHKIHLVAHSMGNQVLGHALDALSNNKKFKIFEEVLLLNADIENNAFEPGQPFESLDALSERIHIYIHRSDDALRISRYTKNFNRRLGHRGPKSLTFLPSNAFVVDTTKAKQDVDASFFNELREKAVDHWGYLYRSEVIKDINFVLSGEEEHDIETRSPATNKNNVFLL